MSRRLRRQGLSLVLVVALLTAGAALLPAASSAQTGATATGTIQDANTSAGLAGAYVLLETASGHPVATTTATSNGAYSFSGLQPETTYYLYASDSGYEPSPNNEISVGSTSAIATIDLSPALYSGTITDHASGYALESAGVMLLNGSTEVDEAYTNDNGYYAFPESDYSAGVTYHVEATGSVGDGTSYAPAYYSSGSATGSPTESGGTGLTPASPGGGKSAVSIAVTSTVGVITGRITDGAGAVGAAQVYAYNPNNGVDEGYSFSSASGTYVIPELQSGSYDVEAVPPSGVSDVAEYYTNAGDQASATPVSVTSPAGTSQINIKLPSGATISGTVTDSSGSGVDGVTVRVETAGGTTVASASTDGGSAAGTYSISGLPPGTYYVYLDAGSSDQTNAVNYLSQWYGATSGTPGAEEETQATAVSISAGGGAVVNQSLASGGEVTGAVTDAGTGDGLGAEVILLSASPAPDTFGADSSDETGKYTVYGVQPGTYDAAFRTGGSYVHYDTATSTYSFFNDAYAYSAGGSSLTGSLSGASPVTVSANATTTLSAALPPGAEIQGTVTANGQPLQGIEVSVYTSSDTALGLELGADDTAADGAYAISHLMPGAYKIGFSATTLDEAGDAGDLAFQYYNGQPTLASASAQTVSAGQDLTGINASLLQGGAISGTVTDATSGQGLSTLTVELLDAGGDVLERTQTQPDGSYLFSGVPAGSYYVEFDSAGTSDQTQFYGPSQVLAGAKPVSVTAGQTTSGINAALGGATTPAATTTVTSTVTVPAVTTTSSTPAPTTPTKPAVGAPTVSAVKLAGIATRKATLSFTLIAGRNAAPLKSVRITLPKGLSFVAKSLTKDLKLGAKGSAKLARGVLTITLTSAERSVTVSFKAGSISVTPALATEARKQKLASEKIGLLITSSSGVKTALIETVRKPA